MNSIVSVASVASASAIASPLDLAQRAAIEFQELEAIARNLRAQESAICDAREHADSAFFAWRNLNPKPMRPDDLGRDVTGSAEYERWFKRIVEAETEEEREALKMIDPNRELKADMHVYDKALVSWRERERQAKLESGALELEQRSEEITSAIFEFGARVAEMPARTFVAIQAKARIAKILYPDELDNDFAMSLVNDLVNAA